MHLESLLKMRHKTTRYMIQIYLRKSFHHCQCPKTRDKIKYEALLSINNIKEQNNVKSLNGLTGQYLSAYS
jgi:uncharacterized membrane protein YgaE (UPF0421/DUF939 family)